MTQIIYAAINWLARYPHGRVGQLSQQLGISGRYLQRLFLEGVGYGLKTFQSILRFQRLLHLARMQRTRRALADL